MRCESWTDARPEEMAAWYVAEASHWRRTLDWETAALWPVLEQARTSRALPGFVLRSASGLLAGWTYAAERDGELHCGALSASEPAGTARLLDALLALPAAVGASRIVCFAFSEAPALQASLAARGFRIDPHDYMVRPLVAVAGGGRAGRPWDVRDLDATVDLLRDSYPAVDATRAFAPHGRTDEWRRYVTDLVLGHGCGRFKPSLSRAVPGAGGALDAIALVTDLGAGTAHLAQLAVRPGLRGAGLGAELIEGVAAAGAAAGFARLSLLVGSGNTTARRLYTRLGLSVRARFISATRAGAQHGLRGSSAA